MPNTPLDHAYDMLGQVEAQLQAGQAEQRKALAALDAREAELLKLDTPEAQAELDELRRARAVAVDDLESSTSDSPDRDG